MPRTTQLDAQLAALNESQRLAAETLDGPLLVIAGPGTGKTQLLSVRAANILANRDVAPENILCLTFTDAGSRAMKKRLVELVGRKGYGIEVYTFHAFANRLKNLDPEYFETSASARLATDLQQHEILNSLLSELNASNPLFSAPRGRVRANLRDVASAIQNLERLGITPDELRAIAHQNLESIAWLSENEVVRSYLSQPVKGGQAKKEEFMRGFAEAAARIEVLAPRELMRFVIDAPGIYQPLLLSVRDLVANATLIEGNNTKGYRDVRDSLGKASKGEFTFAEQACSLRALELADVFERYRAALLERDLFDYQDMINEAIESLENHPDFLSDLQDRYRYLQVDEFQDTNGSQMRIVSLLCQGLEQPNVMAVGDDDQAIMRFQGASVTGIRQFRERFDPVSVVLKKNYRSTPALVELGQKVANQIVNRLVSGEDKAIEAARLDNDQDEFFVRIFEGADIQYDAVATDIRRHIDEGFVANAKKPEEAIAVIASKHASLRALIPYLSARGVPFTYRVNAQLTEIESLQTFFALLRAVCALADGDVRRTESELTQIVASPELGLDPLDVVTFMVQAHRSHDGWLAELGRSSIPRLRKLHDELLGWAAKAPSAPVRELIFEIARPLIAYYEAQEEADPLAAAQFQAGVRRLLKLAEDELHAAAIEQRALRLPQVMDLFARCRDFKIEIDASVPLGRPDAITLTTAHGSKGLEYDLVYVIDADQNTWHRSGSSRGMLPKNILTGTEPHDEDVTRLFFVAITRAKRFLEITSAEEIPIRELEGNVEAIPEKVDPDSLSRIIEVNWRDRIAVSTPERGALLTDDDLPDHLSASSLNNFVTYVPGCKNSVLHPAKRILGAPSAPSASLDFGNLVHAYLEEYATRVLEGRESAGPLADKYRELVRWLDYPSDDVRLMVNRFERIVRTFTPQLPALLGATHRSEAEIHALTPSGVPLYGKCDVLMVDDDAKTLRVIDYKTGQSTKQRDASYTRQLDFYTILLENSTDYQGYHVTDVRDIFVEPMYRTTGDLVEVKSHTTSPETVEHLEKLIDAVWRRIQTRRFDTSDFEKSEEFRDLMAKHERGLPAKLQRLYEDWLIATA